MTALFVSLRYPSSASPDGWGINVWRIVRRNNEETLWTAWSRDGGGFHRVSQAGRLVQHNSLDRKLVTNLRLGFIHRPGSDLFVVFNEDRARSDRPHTGRCFRPPRHRPDQSSS